MSTAKVVLRERKALVYLSVDIAAGVDVNATAGCASVLATALDTPVVAETTVSPNLLHALKRVTKFDIYVVRTAMDVFAGLVILLPVKEPDGDLELKGVLNDGDYTLNLISVEFTSTLGGVNFGLLAHKVGETPADALNGCERELRERKSVSDPAHMTTTQIHPHAPQCSCVRRCWCSSDAKCAGNRGQA
jgi:hypothetical protein